MDQKLYVDVKLWNKFIYELCYKINKLESIPTKVYGVPRGGCLVAIEVANRMNIELISKPEEGCLVVDDLIDSGYTASKFKDYTFMVLIDKRTNEECKNKWIEFWYEKTESDDKDLVMRIAQRLNVEV
jgi:hypoxanthine phosphoribosyltransferase